MQRIKMRTHQHRDKQMESCLQGMRPTHSSDCDFPTTVPMELDTLLIAAVMDAVHIDKSAKKIL